MTCHAALPGIYTGRRKQRFMNQEQERQVVRGLQEGNADAWRELYDDYCRQVWQAVARMMGPNAADVADVVQETFMAAARSARTLPSSWRPAGPRRRATLVTTHLPARASTWRTHDRYTSWPGCLVHTLDPLGIPWPRRGGVRRSGGCGLRRATDDVHPAVPRGDPGRSWSAGLRRWCR